MTLKYHWKTKPSYSLINISVQCRSAAIIEATLSGKQTRASKAQTVTRSDVFTATLAII